MDGSPMDFSAASPVGQPGNYFNSSVHPALRTVQSPTTAQMRNRARRPSSLSLVFDKTKPLGALSMTPSASIGASLSGDGSASLGGTTILQPAALISEFEGNTSRARASSSASSMSLGLSPSRGNLNLEEGHGTEDTPTARPSRTGHIAAMRRKRHMIGISLTNGSEGSLSNASNGRVTPDIVRSTVLADEVNALAMDPNITSSPMKDNMPSTPSRLPYPTPFALKGPLKNARLLSLRDELTAPFLDTETRSEAAFSRLVASSSDLSSRLHLTIHPGASPSRKRMTRDWMSSEWAGRFPESASAEDDLSPATESDDSDPSGQTGDATLVGSRPPSVLGQVTGMAIEGRSRSGSTMTAPGDLMMVGSYNGTDYGEIGLGGMDLDMASNMSSPVSTPATSSWREPVPFFHSSKKRKHSAVGEQEKFDFQAQTKRRKILSPHGTPLSLNPTTGSSSGSGSNSGSFVYPTPKSPYQAGHLSMTALPNQGTTSLGGYGNTHSGTLGHQRRKSGSISGMSWSRPGSAQSSPSLRPTIGQSGMPVPIGMLLGPSLLSHSMTMNPATENEGGFTFAFASTNTRTLAGSNAHGNTSSPRMGGGASFAYPSHTMIGQYGGPMTSSPSSRPMMKLPTRALHAPATQQPPNTISTELSFGLAHGSDHTSHVAETNSGAHGDVVGLSLQR
ncbi:hypothetical protein FRC14_001259 [Serendipita sp. 396]|nr:hypothetical protein FRC14_001259 [Serendipita sp. 396]KAG8774375.1 hypothetical protein FRC15_001335 [Serendipita sp. 397]KAG8789536.1 hypothetical protein FRC16_001210 [Serendipita sp. 398]KAG8853424.1 hypothetical protein FRC20_001227 [Serendipita sp. 405]